MDCHCEPNCGTERFPTLQRSWCRLRCEKCIGLRPASTPVFTKSPGRDIDSRSLEWRYYPLPSGNEHIWCDDRERDAANLFQTESRSARLSLEFGLLLCTITRRFYDAEFAVCCKASRLGETMGNLQPTITVLAVVLNLDMAMLLRRPSSVGATIGLSRGRNGQSRRRDPFIGTCKNS